MPIAQISLFGLYLIYSDEFIISGAI